jgi:tetratricopeptide (TPR) repeat protein
MECATRLEKVIVSLIAGAFILAGSPGVIGSSDDCASLLEKAQALLTQEQVPEARDVILIVVRKCPQNAQAYNLLGISYDEQSLYKEAQAAYQKAISLNPGWAAYHNNLAVSYYRAGGTANAIEEFRKAIRLDPLNQFAAVNLAKYYVDQREYRQALDYFQIADVAKSQDPALLLGLAKAYFGAGMEEAALQTISSLNQLGGTDAKVRFSLGLLLAENGQYAAAVKQFQTIPASDRDFAVNQNLGLAYSKLGRFAEAQTAYRNALRIEPSNPEPYLGIGQDFSAMYQFDRAVYWLSQAHERSPKRGDITCALAEALIQGRQFDRAHDLLSDALKYWPHDPTIQQSLGDLYSHQGQNQLAIKAYQESLSYAPRRFEVHLALAQLYQGLGRVSEAKAELDQVLRIATDNSEANATVGRIALQLGQIAIALDSLKKALQEDPNNLNANEDLATIQLRQGSSVEAQAVLEKLVRLDPNNPRYHYLLGQALLKSGRKEEAQREFTRSQELVAARAKDIM